MTISDRFLHQLRTWLTDGGEIPATVRDIRIRDDSATLQGSELILTADEPEEHDTMPGMERIEGTATVSISLDDVHRQEDRQWILGEVARILRGGTGSPNRSFEDWLAAEDHGLLAYGFRVSGSTWEPEENRRITGTINFDSWACLT